MESFEQLFNPLCLRATAAAEYELQPLVALLSWLDPNTKWHSTFKISSPSENPSQDTPQSGSRLCVLQTPAPRNNVADIIPISRCPSGGVETCVIYLHNDCIHLCGNVASRDAAAGQITRAVAQSHSCNQSRLHMNIYTSPMPIGCFNTVTLVIAAHVHLFNFTLYLFFLISNSF